jgi:hypothetical protein
MDRMIAAAALLLASPAWAEGGTAIPEPSNWALFALGFAGVLIGRFGMRSRKRPDDK